jgi:ABC-type sugar transport system ATPase subunit
VLLLEEPSQGVDVGAQARLHIEINRFAADGGAVLVSSSDADELARLCHRVLVFQRGKVAAELERSTLSEASISHALLAEPTGAGA